MDLFDRLRSRLRLRLFGIFCVAFIAHIESLTYWFVALDTAKLIESSHVQRLGDGISVLTQPMMHGTGFTNIALFYRPLSSFSYTIDHWLWGVDPTGYHLTTLVMHGVAAVLVAIAVSEMADATTGHITALLFALHPLTTEVVPAAARRHDVLMVIFMLGSLTLFIRHTERDARLAGSLVLYALALGAKEPALMTVGLVFVWTATQQFERGPIPALRAAFRDAIPFALVTVAYLAVRFAVLGGLGGYHSNESVTPADISRVVVEYVISLFYPSAVIDTALTAGGLWLGVLLVLVALVIFVSVSGLRSLSMDRSRLASVPLFIGFIGGCALIPLIAFSPIREGTLDMLVHLQPVMHHSYLYPSPAHATTGLLLLGSCLLGVLWALTTRLSTVNTAVLVFFVVWLLAPLVLFFRSGLYTIRTGYLSLIPAMAILSLLLVSASREILYEYEYEYECEYEYENGISLGRNTALVGIVLLLVVPMVVTSPLFHPYDGWKQTGEVNRLVFNGIENEVSQLNGADGTTVRVVGLPVGSVSSQSFPRVKSIVHLEPKAVESWLELQHPHESEITVVADGRATLQGVPERISVESTRNGNQGPIVVEIRYGNSAADHSLLDTQSLLSCSNVGRSAVLFSSRWSPKTTAPTIAPYQSVPTRMRSVAPTATGRV